jgi:hypothetical protein
MKLSTLKCATAGLTAAIWAFPAIAQEPPTSGSATLDALLACRDVVDPAERVACQDRHLADLATALEAGNLVIVEQQAVRAVERDGFGLAMPSLSGFGGLFRRNARADQGGGEDAVIAFEDGVEAQTGSDGRLSALRGLAVASAETNREGALVITLENGQVWLQTDSIGRVRVRGRHLNEGLTAEVETGALNSYFMTLSHNSRRFRVRRLR